MLTFKRKNKKSSMPLFLMHQSWVAGTKKLLNVALHSAACEYQGCSSSWVTSPGTVTGFPIYGRMVALLSVHPAWHWHGHWVFSQVVSQLKKWLLEKQWIQRTVPAIHMSILGQLWSVPVVWGVCVQLLAEGAAGWPLWEESISLGKKLISPVLSLVCSWW